ncbi:SecDF P1 head subdomain-containing protein [Actinomadura flavalba]|uniref:SecDF P1 head subdomain-containing protein n=1 Tax=Actinomadura flavalba TaxID=1120938 RepID=UPI00036503DE|nr:hypothetical protein [Actinomadura flavalba]
MRVVPRRGRKRGRQQEHAADAAVAERSAPVLEASPPADPEERRRARLAARQREAAELKRSRAAARAERIEAEERTQATGEHRSALLIMVVLLGLLIAAVAVAGTMLAASKRDKAIALRTPLNVYPVTQTTPGQCPAGTQGVTGQVATGPVCYQLAQGITIRSVTDLRVQRADAGGFDVAVTLRGPDRRAFATLTRASVGRDVAFVTGDQLVTAPRVDMPITDGKVVITGSPNRAEADRLVTRLRGS